MKGYFRIGREYFLTVSKKLLTDCKGEESLSYVKYSVIIDTSEIIIYFYHRNAIDR